MYSNINLGNYNLDFTFGSLKISTKQISYGAFTSDIPRHVHGKKYYELHLVTDGIGTLVIDRGEFPLKTRLMQ